MTSLPFRLPIARAPSAAARLCQQAYHALPEPSALRFRLLRAAIPTRACGSDRLKRKVLQKTHLRLCKEANHGLLETAKSLGSLVCIS